MSDSDDAKKPVTDSAAAADAGANGPGDPAPPGDGTSGDGTSDVATATGRVGPAPATAATDEASAKAREGAKEATATSEKTAAASAQNNAGEPDDAPSPDAKPDDRERGEADTATLDGAAAAKDPAKDDAPIDADDAKKSDSPRGNPLDYRSLAAAGTGLLGLFFLMAKNTQWRLGVPLGVFFGIVAAAGILGFIGSFDDGEDRVVHKTTAGALALPAFAMVVSFIGFAASLSLAQRNTFGPQWGWGIVVTLLFVAFIASIFRVGVVLGPFAKDELGEERPLLKRHGFWVVLVGGLLYFPAMGIFSLWDPWETHYGEVAREILARDDWISLWWAQDGWFWSKPILNFWIQSLSMAALGTHYHADQMLTTGAAHPEWVVRAPNVLMTILAQYVIYKGVAKVFGRRAGLLGALALATMPDWFFLAHQTMTDMPFVSAMTAAMGMVMLALSSQDEERVRLFEVAAFGRKFRFSGFHLVFGTILLCALPQIVYLLTRNVELVLYGSGPKGFRLHLDEFKSGSALNCGLPGNEACHPSLPASIPRGIPASPTTTGQSLARFFGSFEPTVQGLFWLGLLSGLLYLNWGERRVRRLYYIGAWFFAAIATMGKGPAGIVLPGVCAAAFIATNKRWREFLKVEIWSGVLVVAVVAAPWFVAMYIRHGSPFTDRLFFHDMFNRAFSHVHDTNEGDDTSVRFYLWQLGYALFPWTGLVPLGLTYWMRRPDAWRPRLLLGLGLTSALETSDKPADLDSERERQKGDASIFLVMWFVFAFALFSFMGTKFHHYIFPAVPPAAMLVGVALDEALRRTGGVDKNRVIPYGAGLLVGMGVLLLGVAKLFPGSFFGTKVGAQQADLADPSVVMAAVLVTAGVGVIGATIAFFNRPAREENRAALREVTRVETSPYRGGIAAAEEDEDAERAPHESLMIAGAAVAGAMLLVLVGRDLATKPAGADQPGAIRLLQLFTYNYRRAWPDNLDFGAALKAFSIVAVGLSLLFAVKRLRGHAVALFAALGFVFALWGVDVYMVKTAPHWGQREVIEAYYKGRASPDEPLVAYQMNWKGENFYTSNRVPAFVSSGAPFTKWIKEQKDKGVKVVYFVTEHGRVGGLRSEVGAVKYTDVTDKNVCNKFLLVRAEL